jgi:hypothetical protein
MAIVKERIGSLTTKQGMAVVELVNESVPAGDFAALKKLADRLVKQWRKPAEK